MIILLDDTKNLMVYFTKLHSLNNRMHQLEIEESVFVVDENVHLQKKQKIISEMTEILEKVELWANE